MCIETFTETVQIAVLSLVATGAVSAALWQFVKQTIQTFAKDFEIPATWMAILSGLTSGGLCLYFLLNQDIPLIAALAATLVALYAPQPMHDALKAIQNAKKCEG